MSRAVYVFQATRNLWDLSNPIKLAERPQHIQWFRVRDLQTDFYLQLSALNQLALGFLSRAAAENDDCLIQCTYTAKNEACRAAWCMPALWALWSVKEHHKKHSKRHNGSRAATAFKEGPKVIKPKKFSKESHLLDWLQVTPDEFGTVSGTWLGRGEIFKSMNWGYLNLHPFCLVVIMQSLLNKKDQAHYNCLLNESYKICGNCYQQCSMLNGNWWLLQKEGAPQQLVRVEESELLGDQLDVTVAAQDLSPGAFICRRNDQDVVLVWASNEWYGVLDLGDSCLTFLADHRGKRESSCQSDWSKRCPSTFCSLSSACITVIWDGGLAGDVALRIPEKLAITLDRVFQDDAVAELLTTNKLSELACLTLYLMYEKKAGKDSFWFEYIKVRQCYLSKDMLLWRLMQLRTK